MSQASNYLDKIQLLVNEEEEICRQKTKKDPTGRGWRFYKRAIRDIIDEMNEDSY